MPLASDVVIDASKFDPKNVDDETKKVNLVIESMSRQGPKWYEVGATKYNEMREAGETPLPAPVFLPEAEDAELPSRDHERRIPIRIYRPQSERPSRGIFLHYHGGGFVLATHKQWVSPNAASSLLCWLIMFRFDATLKRFADNCQLTAISVGYRLAPDHPFPAAVHDCCDAAEYLVDHGEEYGGKLLFIGGESAGSCLSAVTAFQLMRSRPKHRLAGVVFPFGQFDLTLALPEVSLSERPLVINREAMNRFQNAYAPGTSVEDRKNPMMSPLYENMRELGAASTGGTLPPALFLVGTEDALLDDTLLMGLKWQITGSEAIVKIYPGQAHGFTAFPLNAAQEAIALQIQFVNEKFESYSHI
jgi:acetyl esterase/lipase